MSALLPAVPESLLAKPLDYLLADHFRQRAVLSLMMRLAEGSAPPDSEAAVRDYLRSELPLHYADEEADLFPALRRRCLPEDNLDALLFRLHGEHIEGNACAAILVQMLSELCQAPSARNGIPTELKRFVSLERVHLALENATLIPLARVRLAPSDLAQIGERMRARRLTPGPFRGTEAAKLR